MQAMNLHTILKSCTEIVGLYIGTVMLIAAAYYFASNRVDHFEGLVLGAVFFSGVFYYSFLSILLIFSKKLVALAWGAIVFKLPLLGVFLVWITDFGKVHLGAFGIGVALFALSSVIYALKWQSENQETIAKV